MGSRRSSSYQGDWVTVKVTGDKRFEHSLHTDLETILYYASVVTFLICRYIFRIAWSCLSVKFTHWVKVKVTGYHHTSMLSTTVAHPDKYTEVDPEWQTLVQTCRGG